jgi:hypothetical protein
VFTELDIVAAFNRIRIAEGHIPDHTVRALRNAGHAFRTNWRPLDVYATAYLDDILVYSKKRESMWSTSAKCYDASSSAA